MISKIIVLFFIFVLNSYALDKIYFLPSEAKEAKKDIVKIFQNSTKSIDIAIYSFTYKKFLKALKKAAKNGSHITIYYDKTKLKFPKKFKLIEPKRKLHIKLAIADEKYVIFGSANYKKESFSKNYEIINITDDKQKAREFIKIVKKIK